MQPSLPYFPNIEKKFALDHTNDLKDRLAFLVKSFNSVELISSLSTINVKENLFDSHPEIFTEVPGLQFLIDLCLKNKNDSKSIPTLDDIYIIMNLLDHYFRSIKYSITTDSYENEFDKNMLVFNARMHAMLLSINREKYFFQQDEHIKGIYPHLDNHFEKKFGFTITESIVIFSKIWKEFQEKVSQKYDAIFQKIINSNYTKEKARQFYSTMSENDYLSFIKTINESFTNPRELYVISVPEFCKKYNFSSNKVESYLSYFSCKFGDNNTDENIPFGEFFINCKPLIHLSPDEFFCPVPDLLYWNFPLIIEKIIKDNDGTDSKIWHKLDKHKEKYAIDKIVEFLSRLLPQQQIRRNLYYNFEGKRREVDVLAYFDNKILIFEEKSSSLSPRAKFGRLDRLGSDLEYIIEDAFSQTSDAERYLLSSKIPQFEDSKKRMVLTIENLQKKQIFHINVTLEPLRTLAAILRKLRPLGLFENSKYPWSVYLYDLDIITHILEGKPSFFIHYLEQRIKCQSDETFTQAEEIQLFDWYLSHLNLQPFSSKNESILLLLPTESFSKFDDYFNRDGPKPTINLDKKTRKIIERLQEKQEFGYIDKIIELLNKRSKSFIP